MGDAANVRFVTLSEGVEVSDLRLQVVEAFHRPDPGRDHQAASKKGRSRPIVQMSNFRGSVVHQGLVKDFLKLPIHINVIKSTDIRLGASAPLTKRATQANIDIFQILIHRWGKMRHPSLPERLAITVDEAKAFDFYRRAGEQLEPI